MAWVTLLLWIVFSAPLLLLSMIAIDEKIISNYSIITQIISPLLSAVLCFSTASIFPKQHDMRKVWTLVGSGILLWGIGAILFSLYPLVYVGQETPYPWYGDIGYLLIYLPIIAAFIILKQYLNVKISTWGLIAAITIFWVSLGIAVWLNLSKLSDSDSILTYLVTLMYVLGDPVLLGASAMVASLLGTSGEGRSWWFVLIGFVLFYFANVMYTYLTLLGSYASGNQIDIGWILGFGFIAVAAMMTRAQQKNDSILNQGSIG